MLLRSSGIKRLDLYRQALSLLRQDTSLRVAVITPDSSIAAELAAAHTEVYLRPSDEEMRALFARSRVFLLLSDVEGFGLPPLEAMGSGCVAACRDSGGVRCYMTGELAGLLFPLAEPVDQIVTTVASRIRHASLPGEAYARQTFAEGLQASLATRKATVRRLQAVLGEQS